MSGPAISAITVAISTRAKVRISDRNGWAAGARGIAMGYGAAYDNVKVGFVDASGKYTGESTSVPRSMVELVEEPAGTFTVFERAYRRGEWVGLRVSRLSYAAAKDRAYALVYCGAKNVMIFPEVDGKIPELTRWDMIYMSSLGVYCPEPVLTAAKAAREAGPQDAPAFGALVDALHEVNPNVERSVIAAAAIRLSGPLAADRHAADH